MHSINQSVIFLRWSKQQAAARKGHRVNVGEKQLV